ncbi:hypothetical protein EDEG_01306 [Edhazardia aedis USNM 41457]|uniref:Uncharacterized protein n=1 Tax=Edhazardia aedis (strain USNM 41457) TaxID=1003232 RepID=J9D9I9_EDHAE|nr:hypothetical protein EDEG_01306 [Edhazardia aedis USNM 41457]|eukprot:EJW04436.1 hypothetical protein EDEG_01306 [Edhazardia aedis USNM 41457]
MCTRYESVISTEYGVLPYIIDPEQILSDKKVILYIDDIYYKKGYYAQGGTMPFHKFFNLKNTIVLKFRNGKVLKSIREHYKIKKEEYEHFISIGKPDIYQIYGTNELSNGDILEDPKDLAHFLSIKDKTRCFGTGFVNNATSNGEMLIFDDNSLSKKVDLVCKDECCEKLSEGYLSHLKHTKEINFKVFLNLHNYFQLEKYIRYVHSVNERVE